MPYPILALLDLLFTNLVARLLVNWWAAWFCKSNGFLPWCLLWFQTFDAPLDAGWRDGYKGYREPKNWLDRWWQRTKWLYRNPAYGFSYFVLGQPFNVREWEVVFFEQGPDKDYFHAVGPRGQFNITYYGKWGTWKLGWKAWNYFDPATHEWKPNYQWGPLMRVPCVFSINPFRRKGV